MKCVKCRGEAVTVRGPTLCLKCLRKRIKDDNPEPPKHPTEEKDRPQIRRPPLDDTFYSLDDEEPEYE